MLDLKRLFGINLILSRFDEGGDDKGGDDKGGDDKGGDDKGGGKTYDEAYVKKLRDEAAGYRTKLRETETNSETKLKEFQTNLLKSLGIEVDPKVALEKQLEEAKTKAEEATTKANAKLIKAEVKLQASELGIKAEAVEAAFLLLPKEGITVEGEEVKGVKEALEALLEKHSYLKGESKPGGENGSKGNGGKQGGEGKKTAWEEGQELAKARNERNKPQTNDNW